MNAPHIGDIAVTSSVFLYKLSIRDSGIKRCRRMRGIKLSAVVECAE
jgi:hypothetical protein